MSQAGGQVQICALADGKLSMKIAKATDLELLPEVPRPAGAKTKNINWLDGQAGKLIVDSLPLGKDFLPASFNTMLTNNHVEAGM